MFVEKIEVPAFRVLRNVVLEFDRGQEPRIFPLGSENGGGKSTLLQLLFALLHCSSDPERHPYLANILGTDAHAGDEEERLIARLTIRLNDEQHVLEFVSLSDGFLKKHLGEDAVRVGFRAETTVKVCRMVIESITKQIERHRAAPTLRSRKELRDYQQSTIKKLEAEAAEASMELASSFSEMERIKSVLAAIDYSYVTTYAFPTEKIEHDSYAIVCHAPGCRASETADILAQMPSKIFLLGPSNQQYLFLNRYARKALLTSQRRDSSNDSDDDAEAMRPQIQYMQHLDQAENVMPGFFAYDWLSVEPLVQLFITARNEDFQQKVKAGDYGNRYAELLNEVNGLLLGKQVRPLIDSETGLVSGIEFLVVRPDGHETPLSPEDLSQGELKRLMIYAWLRAHRAVDALVLIDEIEASFHPDWQYGIIRDLQEWAPKNQYILATHSYELCNALTPRHVRTLEPPLRPGQAHPTRGHE